MNQDQKTTFSRPIFKLDNKTGITSKVELNQVVEGDFVYWTRGLPFWIKNSDFKKQYIDLEQNYLKETQPTSVVEKTQLSNR